jgi:hypothetical protein
LASDVLFLVPLNPRQEQRGFFVFGDGLLIKPAADTEPFKPTLQTWRLKGASNMVRQIGEAIYMLDLTIEQWVEQLNRAQPLRPFRLAVIFTRSARTRMDGQIYYDTEPVVGRMVQLRSGAWRFARLTARVRYSKLSDLRVGKGLPGDSRVVRLIDGIEDMLAQRMGLLEVLSSLSKAMPGKLSSILAQCARRSDEVIDMSERIHIDWNADARAAEESVRAKRRERYQKLKQADKVDEAVGA